MLPFCSRRRRRRLRTMQDAHVFITVYFCVILRPFSLVREIGRCLFLSPFLTVVCSVFLNYQCSERCVFFFWCFIEPRRCLMRCKGVKSCAKYYSVCAAYVFVCRREEQAYVCVTFKLFWCLLLRPFESKTSVFFSLRFFSFVPW